MIPVKSQQEIEIISKGAEKLSLVMRELLKQALSGTVLFQLEDLALKLLKDQGLEPNFNKISNYKWATCINVNNGIVHGIPGDYNIKEGDLISIDTGGLYKGFHTDIARTVIVSKTPGKYPKRLVFLESGRKALRKALKEVRAGKRIGSVSQAIEKSLGEDGLLPIDSFVGHGIGKKLHEEPQIPGFLISPIRQTALMKEGMVFCIEVIYSTKGYKVEISEDGWTAFAKGVDMVGLFEDMVAVTDKGHLVLTKD